MRPNGSTNLVGKSVWLMDRSAKSGHTKYLNVGNKGTAGELFLAPLVLDMTCQILV